MKACTMKLVLVLVIASTAATASSSITSPQLRVDDDNGRKLPKVFAGVCDDDAWCSGTVLADKGCIKYFYKKAPSAVLKYLCKYETALPAVPDCNLDVKYDPVVKGGDLYYYCDP